MLWLQTSTGLAGPEDASPPSPTFASGPSVPTFGDDPLSKVGACAWATLSRHLSAAVAELLKDRPSNPGSGSELTSHSAVMRRVLSGPRLPVTA